MSGGGVSQGEKTVIRKANPIRENIVKLQRSTPLFDNFKTAPVDHPANSLNLLARLTLKMIPTVRPFCSCLNFMCEYLCWPYQR